MASGTPFVTTKLEGIPEEYGNYIFFTEHKDEEIIKKIEEILRKDEKELELLGNKAREFVIENKSAVKQVGRINEFLKNNV